MKTLIPIIFLIGLSFGVDNNKRTDAVNWMKEVNVATSDTTVTGWDSTRAIYADVGGIIKFNMKNAKGFIVPVVMTLNDAMMYPLTGITKIFPLYNGTDSITTQYYDSTGTLRRGIRICR